MTDLIENPWRGAGLFADVPLPGADAGPVAALLSQCPAHAETPLHELPELAAEAGVAALWVKDESGRMGLGSFKALGAAFALAVDAAAADPGDMAMALVGRTYVTASAGNHGMSVAAGALVFGARAVIYIADTVPEAFAARLRAKGAEVVREGAIYEDSMAAAETAAQANGWQLLSDSSWDGYTEPALRVMEGYAQLAAEAVHQCPGVPSHVLLQAGVGGMAAAVAAHVRAAWGGGPRIIVVEPDRAPALYASIKAGALVDTKGAESAMGRLDCKTASLVALAGLSRDADAFSLISEEDAAAGVAQLAGHGLATTPSGGAGLAALLAGLGLPRDARVLAVLSEGPEGG